MAEKDTLDKAQQFFRILMYMSVIAALLLAYKGCKDLKKETEQTAEALRNFAEAQEDRIDRVEQGFIDAVEGIGTQINTGQIVDEITGRLNPKQSTRTNLVYTGGNPLQTCESQGNVCQLSQYCEGDQWILSSNKITCCAVSCISRIQAPLLENALGEVTVEKVQSGYIVWYGEKRDYPFIGATNSVFAKKNEDIYEYTVATQTYSFRVTDSSNANFAVEKVES